ncbi:SH2 domain containing 3Cb isoform X2 [Scleropages formosus]|uniref:SH2 domain containing 3Cb n=1 Tax=Scleropages formosus TaxID=113540 RepID=A0A8C9TIX0_SCLFO|nr:SH2 domain-containing protein 3C isoform X2 [Scleropages formosus]
MKKQKFNFKWFGNITNLSRSRSSDKANSKVVPKHHGSLSEAPLGERSTDAMEVDPRGLVLASSRDTSSHLVTLPRRSLKQKGKRGSKKATDEDELQRQQGGDYVRDSPLLSALSNGHVIGPDGVLVDPSGGKRLAGEASGAGPDAKTKSAALKSEKPTSSAQHSPPAHCKESWVSEQPGTQTTPQQKCDPTSQVTVAIRSSPPQTPKQDPKQHEGPVEGSEDAEPLGSLMNSMDSRGEYVKFSKEKYQVDGHAERLEEELEEELKLNSGNIRGQGWYHGHISREVSEKLVMRNGDFLIRDSLTSVGDYVLTSRWNNKVLHFVIGKVLVGTQDPNPQFQYFLGRESFSSVAALVHFYAGTRQPVSLESGAQIYSPINRTLPLHYLEADFTMVQEKQDSTHSPSGLRETCMEWQSITMANRLAIQSQELHNPLSPVRDALLSPPYTSSTHHRSPSVEACRFCPPSACAPPSKGYVGHLHVKRKKEERSHVFNAPPVEMSSSFRPGQYQSPLMPSENKPLEVGILKRVKELLTEVDARTAAQHLTMADCMVARMLDFSTEMQNMMAVDSGLELLTLPHGQQLRLDLLERFHTMSIMIAAELLGCTGSREERAALLHKTILLAAELKSSMGNMFGFAAVMRALALPQISRLEQMWMILRQRHTEAAILYEKKLKPYLKTINAEGCVLPDTTFPHVVPLLLLLESSVDMGDGVELWDKVDMEVDVVMNHLEVARAIAHEGEKYCSNVQTKLQEFQERPEVLEVFLTEFQMRLLWGSRGSEASQAERYQKFDRVLTALSNKLEPYSGHSVERT